jgi:hypothetical protein
VASQLTRSIVVGVQIILETTDTELELAAIVAELEASLVLPPTLDVAGSTVTIVGARTETTMEAALPPAVGAGFGR